MSEKPIICGRCGKIILNDDWVYSRFNGKVHTDKCYDEQSKEDGNITCKYPIYQEFHLSKL